MLCLKSKQLIANTERIAKDLQTKYDFINDELFKGIELKDLLPNDILNILSVLEELKIYKLSNRILPIKDEKELKAFSWSVGDVVIYLDSSYEAKVLSKQVFMLFHYKNLQTMLFADCMGNRISPNLEKLIQESEFIQKPICIISNLTQVDHYDHLMAIGNIEAIVNASVESFEDDHGLFQLEALNNFRERLLQSLRNLRFTNNIYGELEHIQDKSEFKEQLKLFIRECLSCAHVRPLTEDYMQILNNETKEYELSGTMNLDRVEAVRQKLSESLIKTQSQVSQKNKAGIPRIQVDFPEESQHFHKIFADLKEFDENDKYMETIQMICNKLDLNFNDLRKFYGDFQPKTEPAKSESLEKTQSSDDLILQRYAENDTIYANVNLSIRPLSELLTDIKESNDFDTEKITYLTAFYENVIMHFNDNWCNKTALNIVEWAKQVRGSLKDICEAIAVCKRAHEITSKGEITLRDVQILSLLMFLLTNTGNFAEIATGEGKTIIIATLAVIKVLQGKTVDVITSNEVLASEGVGSTTDFYYFFNVHTGHNNFDATYKKGPRECYKYDVVYGNIGNFQYDYLRDSFEGYETRAGRSFDFLILDEVDCLTVDNGGYIAKLAQPFPGIESLRYIYIKIWVVLNKVEQTYLENFYNKMRRDKNNKIEEQVKKEAYLAEQLKSMPSEMKQLIQVENLLDPSIIPHHLYAYCKSMCDKWIENAIYAKYNCHEKKAYILKKTSDEEELEVIPVDYANTGMTLANTIWSNGLHQFIQLKHNLRVTTDSLTSSFISNIGYIKLYKNNMYGMTGTLGSVAEQKFLSGFYNLQYLRVPRFKPKQFIEYEGVVVRDLEWANCVIMNAYMIVKQRRSVLIICETINDVEILQQNLISLLKFEDATNWIKVRYYYDETFADLVIRDQVGPCEIIISTNIAGRGTDFNTTPDLESNGGLHVCIAFLPCNERVQQQAFGRTSRKGNKGTAQLLFKESDVKTIKYAIVDSTTMQDIKVYRNNIESQKLDNMKKNKVEIVLKQDKIFQEFVDTYREFAQNPEHIYLCMDLKEMWAFWLHSKTFDESVLYDEFLRLAKPILDGKVTFNPFYAVKHADNFLQDGNITNAKESLNHALTLAQSETYMYPVYMKLFDVNITSGNALKNRFIKALKKVSFQRTDANYNIKYKEEALAALEGAEKCITVEIDYIKSKILNDADFQSLFSTQNHSDSGRNTQTNILLKHISSRYNALMVYKNHIKSLALELRDTKEDAAIHRFDNFLKKMIPENSDGQSIKDNIHKKELDELSNVGLSTIYLFREVHDVSDIVIKGAQIQIAAAITSDAACCFFPPLLAIVGPASSILISEGISDIILDLVGLGTKKCGVREYVKAKIINFLIALGTAGLGVILKKWTKLIEVPEKALQGTWKMIQESEWLKNLLTNVVQWCKNNQKIISFIKTSMPKVKYWIDIGVDCINHCKQNGCVQGENFLRSLVGTFVVMKDIGAILESSRPHTLLIVQRTVREIFENKLQSLNLGDIQATVQTEGVKERSWDIFNNTIGSFTQPCSFWNVPDANFTLFSENHDDIKTYANRMCQLINDLIPIDETKQNSEEAIEKIESYLTDFITDDMFERITHLVYATTSSSHFQSTVPMNISTDHNIFKPHKTFVEIHNAYKQLGLDITATTNEIETTYREIQAIHLPGSNEMERAARFHANQKAKDLLIQVHKSIAAEQIIEMTLPATDKRNLENLSRKLRIHIVVDHEATRGGTHFGSNNGEELLMISYRAPTATTPGQYYPTGLQTAFPYTARDNCLYDCLALLLNERGVDPVTSSELRIMATMPSLEHLKYEAIDSAPLFSHPYTAGIYKQIQENILVRNHKQYGN